MRRTQEHMCSTPSLGRIALFIPFAYDDVGASYCKDHSLAIAMMKIYITYASSTGKIPRLAVIRQEGSILFYLVALSQ